MKPLCRSWLLEPDFPSVRDFILTVHSVLLNSTSVFVPDWHHLLARDVSGIVTCMFSIRNGTGSDYSLNICIAFGKQLDMIHINIFACFSKIMRLFLGGLKTFPYICHRLDTSLAKRWSVLHNILFPLFPLYAIALSTFRLAQSTRVLSNDFR